MFNTNLINILFIEQLNQLGNDWTDTADSVELQHRMFSDHEGASDC